MDKCILEGNIVEFGVICQETLLEHVAGWIVGFLEDNPWQNPYRKDDACSQNLGSQNAWMPDEVGSEDSGERDRASLMDQYRKGTSDADDQPV